jgi:hypothetical protein
MEVAALIISIVSALIAGISATVSWFAVRPRTALRINVLFSRTIGVTSSDPEFNFMELLVCSIYNLTTEPVQIVGVSVEADTGKGFERWAHAGEVLYSGPVELSWHQGQYTYSAAFSEESLIFWPPKPVEGGIPRFGVLPVVGHVPGDVPPRAYRISLTDGSGRNHSVIAPAGPLRERKGYLGLDVRFLFQMAGAVVSRQPADPAGTPTRA